MGVVNVTPDSFSDGGRYLDRDHAVAHGIAMFRRGADLVDVGGESTRPGAERVAVDVLDGVFIAIGHTPNTSLFKGQVQLDANGYLVTHEGTRTNTPGVFAAGDVRANSVKRVASAVGEGAMAVTLVHRYLESQ